MGGPPRRVWQSNTADENTSSIRIPQWSHLDDGHMATVTLVDGSSVTATDHHEFWVDSDGRWVELEDIQPGDHLLTPDGITSVATVDISERHSTLVWELDTAIDDTFTVHTGTHDLLVHNQAEGCLPFTDEGVGLNMTRTTRVDGVEIKVKSGHGYRPDHGSQDITSVLDRDAVDSSIANDLADRVNGGASIEVARPGGNFSTFRTEIDGITVEYRVVHVDRASPIRYEVSTYYIP